MADWTNSAKAALDRYCARMRESLEGSGADAIEVTDDLKRHVEAEVAAAQIRVVTEENVNHILARIGEPAIPKERSESPQPATPQVGKRKRPGFILFFFAVLLPLITFGIEWVTHMCASAFFDPMPTLGHALLVLLVPLSNLAAWWAARKGLVERRNKVSVANAFAIGISFYYAFMFLPLMVPGAFAIIWFGWGLLPLCPFFTSLATLRLRSHLRRLGSTETTNDLPGLWWGLAASGAVLAVVALPIPATRYFAEMAVSDSPATSASGVKWLRAIGSRKTILADCYGLESWRADFPLDLGLNGRPVSAEQAREVYFRVTGQPFNHEPPPHMNHFSQRWDFLEDLEWDSGLGGDAVAGHVKGLSLHTSRVDAIVEPDAALAYYEWTMEFKNAGLQQREARAQILLPKGGVVSRLVLWVNGEEREAAFGGRGQVKEAYQKVAIQQRHDPVLVTTCGPDRVLMQCFPVPAGGGVMKVRIGVTAPMVLEDVQDGNLAWPIFLERNFGLPEDFKHAVWIESSEPLKSKSKVFKTDKAKTGQFALRGDLTDGELSEPESSVSARRSGKIMQIWSPCAEEDKLVRQTIQELKEPPPSRIVLVLDGSGSMKEFIPAISRSLHQLPEGVDFAFLLASNDYNDFKEDVAKGSRAFYDKVAYNLKKAPLAGGQDNVPALTRAWDLAAESTNGVILWLHGPQPVLLRNAEGLRQRFERRSDSPRLYEIQTQPGPDRIAEKLDGISVVVSVPRPGKLEDDLIGLILKWRGEGHSFGFARELVQRTSLSNDEFVNEPSRHVMRLWANGKIIEMARDRDKTKAMTLATSAQLVTPVSGAVVLETKSQFALAGLTPAAIETVPIVPEPGAWIVFLAGAILLGGKLFLQRRKPFF